MKRKEKIRQTDFENAERPKTRLKQFGDIFRHRFLELMKISLLQLVFNMPLVVSIVLFHMLVKSASASSDRLNALMTVFLIQGGSFLISIPCSFIGMTGTFYCMKKLIYAEGEFASSSFFVGMHEEWKKGLIIGLLPGFSAALSLIGFFFLFFYYAQVDPVITGLGIAALGIQLITILIISYYSIAQIVVYSNQLRFILKNAFIMLLIRFHFNLLFFLIYPGIFIALICIMDITAYVGVAILGFFAAFGHLMWMLNSVSAFDKFINKEQYPDYYRKGLANINN